MRCAVAIRERARRRAAEKRERQTDGDGACWHESRTGGTWQPIVPTRTQARCAHDWDLGVRRQTVSDARGHLMMDSCGKGNEVGPRDGEA